jgi:glycerol-3-phosphate cytidylyltransferase
MRVLTIGTFDLLHPGHVALFRTCWELSKSDDDFPSVTVALNSDEFIAAYKGFPPVQPLADRVTMVDACRYVDSVMVNCQRAVGDSAAETIDLSGATQIVIGDDWQSKDYLGQLGIDEEWLTDRHMEPVVYVPRAGHHSSRRLKLDVLQHNSNTYGV